MLRTGLKVSFILLATMFFGSYSIAQVDDNFEDFDISQFEVASTSLKSFCTNKTSGQSPTQLISFSLDAQGPAELKIPKRSAFNNEDAEWEYSPGFRFNSNVPIISKNNILVNWSFNYVQLGYVMSDDPPSTHPLAVNLDNHSLKYLNNTFTLFKPLNETRFLLFQAGLEVNGDYDFDNLPELENIRYSGAAIYGFKPSDRLMWGIGVSRTYVGGALNYLPIVYYYQTFKNEKWGLEAVLPSRVQLRMRTNSRNVFLLGYTMEGGTYRLSNFNEYNQIRSGPFPLDPNSNINPNEEYDVELRRSEIRGGLTYLHGFNDFIWIGVTAGYRVNWSFDLDDGDFFRGFDSDDYLLETELSNTPFIQLSLSLVSP